MTPQQDTGKNRINLLDQFYTSNQIAISCIKDIQNIIQNYNNLTWIEPSAGNGSFINPVLEQNLSLIALDIEPHHEKIIKQDFLSWKPPSQDKNYLVFGNPPFGPQSKLTKAFIKHAASFAHFICFILPRSFLKPSMYNAFPRQFHRIFNKELPNNSFVINNEPYDVPCIFEIWEKKDILRELPIQEKPVGFTFMKKNQSHHIGVRRVGVNAGRTNSNTTDLNPQTHYFIQLNNTNPEDIDMIIDKMNKIQFPSNTTGPRSLSKPEIIKEMNQIIQKIN